MTFKKIHRRADIVVPPLAQASTTAHTTSSAGYQGPSISAPNGPPVYNTPSTTATSHSTTASSSSSSGTVVSTSTTSQAVVPTTPPAGSSAPSAHVSSYVPPVTHSVTQHVTYTGTNTGASTATTTSDASTGMGLGSIAGIGVAAVIAIGVVSAFIVWLIRRKNKNHDIDEEPFNRNSFLRNSTAIPDDDAPLPSRTRPAPPPNMAERQPTPLYGQQSFGGDPSGFNYATQPGYGAQPGQMYSPNPFGPGGAPATPLPHSPGFGTTYDQQGFNNGGYQELTRGPGMHDYPPSPSPRGFDPHFDNPHSPSYVGHESFPMPPPGAAAAGGAQYDEHGQEVNHRAMTPAQQGQVVSVPHSVHDGRETPVQLGFAPAAHGGAPAHGRTPGGRPETLYDTDDAYGGI